METSVLEPQETAQHLQKSSAVSVRASASKAAHEAAERLEQIAEVVTGTAEVMGTELSSEGLRIFVRALAHLDDMTIRTALERTAVEVRGSKGFAPKLLLQDVLDRAGVISPAEAEDLDGILAWDLAERVADRHGYYDQDGDVVLRPRVSRPKENCKRCHGKGVTMHGRLDGDRFVRDCACKMREEIPAISQRVTDSVRRIGGWSAIKDCTQERYPFVKRDFLLEYGRWTKIESFRGQSGGEMISIGQLVEPEAGGNKLDGLLEKILRAK